MLLGRYFEQRGWVCAVRGTRRPRRSFAREGPIVVGLRRATFHEMLARCGLVETGRRLTKADVSAQVARLNRSVAIGRDGHYLGAAKKPPPVRRLARSHPGPAPQLESKPRTIGV